MTKTVHKIYIASFFLITIFATLLLTIDGYKYYSAPVEERFFLPQDVLLKSSGFIGHGIGIIGSLLMIIGVASYMLRKRVKVFHKYGFLKHWLEFHIFLCTLGPILVLFHTAFKFGGIVAVSFWSMVAVVLSGVIGKFLYAQIPHTIQGQMVSFNELNSQNENLSHQLRDEFHIPEKILSSIESLSSIQRYKKVNLKTGFIFITKDSFGIKNVIKNLRNELILSKMPKKERNTIIKTAKSKLIISRRIGLLHTMQKLFNYWHIVHLPFAVTMFIIMVVHIIVEIVFGYKWVF
ncbi:MAG: hypothetical protein P4L45_15180 [Ignavibacteriaceae bacterium]|nr:hypothetical protein [Ignavibacteriaceae bacterium]